MENSNENQVEKTRIEVIQNGPLIVNGDLQIKNSSGEIEEKGRAAFCRCGDSANMPYCDGKHKLKNI